MITFKEFLQEDLEADAMKALAKKELDSKEKTEQDKEHTSVHEAALDFIEHCADFPNINKPLFRISGDSYMGAINHALRTRVPRRRDSASRGGSAREQKWLFSQPEWAEYPERRQSIFCSTREEFEVGTVDSDKANLLMIYPFDGVKIAMLDDTDLNTMNILRGTTWGDDDATQIDGITDLINTAFKVFDDLDDDVHDWEDKLKHIKEVFMKGGSFDPTGGGREDVHEAFNKMRPADKKVLMFVAKQIPEKLAPKDIGAKLVTSSGLDLPGKTRECWFSGKYLSVPSRYFNEFKAEVKKLLDSE